jgi:hypothetical protein
MHNHLKHPRRVAPQFQPVEVASRKPGCGWTRTVCKSQRMLDRKLEAIARAGGEVQMRAADGPWTPPAPAADDTTPGNAGGAT